MSPRRSVPRCLLIPLAVLAGLSLVAAGCDARTEDAPATTGATIALEDCHLSAEGLSARVAARCGTLSVPEDRDAVDGRQLELRVAVVPAVTRDPEPDPLFLLAGGPGQAATEVYPAARHALDRVHQKRDIVLVDQRGTGGSNGLDCHVPEGDAAAAYDAERSRAWLADCLTELEERADLRLYTTSVAMADLDDARAALGYERVNLYGGSYGTRAALEYLRRYPDRVRAVVLDGVVPPDLALGVAIARDAQNALDLAFERCAADAVCAAAFPDLADELEAVLDGLAEAPAEVRVPHPVTGTPTDLTLTRDMVAGTLRFLSYGPETVSLIPLLVHTAAGGDLGPLAGQVLQLVGQDVFGISIGMHFSVVCAEDVPFFESDDVELANAETYLADLLTGSLTDSCALWPRGDVPDDFKAPVTSDVPVLILSGEADPVTPPAYGDAVAAHLPASRHLVAPGQGHGTIVRGCMPRVVADFVAAGTVEGLDAECVDDLAPPPFFVSFSGPVPAPEAAP